MKTLTEKQIKKELKKYFKKLTIPCSEYEKFRIETAFRYAINLISKKHNKSKN